MPPYNPPEGNSIDTLFPNVDPIYYEPPSADSIPLALGDGVNNPYVPSQGGTVGIDFPDVGPFYYVPPLGNAIPLEFAPKDDDTEEPKPTQYLFPKDILSEKIGVSNVFMRYRELRALGSNHQELGKPAIILAEQYVNPKGVYATEIGWQVVENYHKTVTVSGFASQQFSNPLIYNKLQFLSLDNKGLSATLYGDSYFQGGVKFVQVIGRDLSVVAAPKVINTTADQFVSARSIAPIALPTPSVSPRMLYTKSINGQSFGNTILERSPMPLGLDHSGYGLTTIWYHTRGLCPLGISSFETGYSRVFDPTQFVQSPALIEQGIFGDIAIKNISEVLRPVGIEPNKLPDYILLENINKHLPFKGFDSASIGSIEIANKSPSVIPSGLLSEKIGQSAISYRIQRISCYGFEQLVFGRPILTKTPSFDVSGINSFNAGTLSITHKNRNITVTSIAVAKYGDPVLWFKSRSAIPKSIDSMTFGSQVLTHGNRELITQGRLNDTYGRPWVSEGVREILPEGVYKIFASSHSVVTSRYIGAKGFDAALFGDRIIPESQTIYSEGFANSFGLASAWLYTRYLGAQGFMTVGSQEQDKWGAIGAYNQTQYIQQNFDINSGLSPIRWTGWTLIENRDKTVNVASFNAQKFGYTKIDNGADVLYPKAPETSIVSTPMIAYRIRRINPLGLESPYLSSWSVVYNDADVVSTQSFNAQLLGKPKIETTRRYYNWIGSIDSFGAGAPMIAFKIRTIDVEKRFSIGPPIIEMPKVELSTNYITCAGFHELSLGSPSLSIHRNIITPRWTHKDYVGQPILKNLTPELLSYGRNSEDFGATSIRLQYRNLLAIGVNQQLFGLTLIADRTSTIHVKGWHSLSIPQKHNVIKLGAPPYSEQRIDLDGKFDETGEYTEGFGIDPEFIDKKRQVGTPGLNQNVIYVVNVQPATSFGIGKVRANTIIVDGGIFDHYFGKDVFVGLKQRQIILNDNNLIDSESVFGKPALSPHTIYAVLEAPAQARYNHPKRSLHFVDGYGGKETGTILGRPTIKNKNREVAPRGFITDSTYTAEVRNKKTVVYCVGIPKPYMPVPSIPLVDQYILHEQKLSFDKFGWFRLERFTLHRELKARGIDSQVFGAQKAEGFIRYLRPTGFNSNSMGSLKYGDTPYMWQGLRVGEHVPFTPESDDMLAMGDTRISLTVRQIELQGFESFISTYDIGSFEERLKVRNTKQITIEAQNIGVQGFDSLMTNHLATIKNNQHFIRPDGNSNQFRKGGYHA